MQIFRLGDIYILGLPGEVLVEIGLEIKKRAGIEKLFIVSLSNDAIGYVCHSQAYDECGYEPGKATELAKGAGEIMIDEALGLIDQIKQSR
jgi:neutral ceramidase